jgi:hypothetical protein
MFTPSVRVELHLLIIPNSSLWVCLKVCLVFSEWILGSVRKGLPKRKPFPEGDSSN